MRTRPETMKMQREMPTWRMIAMRLSGPNQAQAHPGHHSCSLRPYRVLAAASQTRSLGFPSMKKRTACSHHQFRNSITSTNTGHLRRHLRQKQSRGRVAVRWSHGSLWQTLSISRMTSCKDGAALSRSSTVYELCDSEMIPRG